MMFKKRLLNHYQNRFNNIREQYLISVIKNDVEGFHELRVQIKQMHAYFNLLESLHCDFESKKHFRNFRILFKQTGTVRDIHVQQALVKDFEKKLNKNFTDYKQILVQKEEKAVKKFMAFSRKFNINILLRKIGIIEYILNKVSKNPSEINVSKRFRILIDQLINLKNDENYGEKTLHKMRILLKETRYTLEIILECFPEVNLNKELNKALRNLHRILGKWHDADVGIVFIESFGTDSNKLYQEMQINLQKDKETLVTQFEKKWDDFVILLNK